jgi:hypothetical protein
MKPDLLHVITARYNPHRYDTPDRIYRDWVEHMLASGVHLTVVEVQVGDRDFTAALPGVHHIGVRARGFAWQKESPINVGLMQLPAGWKYAAWIDSDVWFRRADWATETVHALQHYDVIQPWSDCYDLGPNDEHMDVHRSFGRIWHERGPIMQGPNAGNSPYKFAHPGFAWAATRRALEGTSGLIDTAALGAGDHHMAMALIGRVADSIHGGMTEGYREPLLRWQERAEQHIRRNLGYLPGTIEHRFHGRKADRNYVGRWDILARHKFDPATDLKRNLFGIYEMAGNKPELERDIDRYFRDRNEDVNSL